MINYTYYVSQSENIIHHDSHIGCRIIETLLMMSVEYLCKVSIQITELFLKNFFHYQVINQEPLFP